MPTLPKRATLVAGLPALTAGVLPLLLYYGFALPEIPAATEPPPFQNTPAFEQWVLFLTGYVVKPLYMLLSLILIVALWRRTAPDLAALRWGLIAFLAGELACAVNYLIFQHESHFSEFLHAYGMVLCFACVTYAFFEGFDARVLRLSNPDKKCAALALCRACYKSADVPCGLKRLFAWLAPLFLLLALLPLCAAPRAVYYNTEILEYGYSFNHHMLYQLFEIRYCPLLAIALYAAAFLALTLKRRAAVAWAKIYLSAATGALGFSFPRLILFQAFRDELVWFNSWEELTELCFVAAAAVILHLFRGALFRSPANQGAHPSCVTALKCGAPVSFSYSYSFSYSICADQRTRMRNATLTSKITCRRSITSTRTRTK